MNRITQNNPKIENEVYKCLIENQLEYLYDNDPDKIEGLTNYINSLKKSEYEQFLQSVVNEFWNADDMWEVIDRTITEIIEYKVPKGE